MALEVIDLCDSPITCHPVHLHAERGPADQVELLFAMRERVDPHALVNLMFRSELKLVRAAFDEAVQITSLSKLVVRERVEELVLSRFKHVVNVDPGVAEHVLVLRGDFTNPALVVISHAQVEEVLFKARGDAFPFLVDPAKHSDSHVIIIDKPFDVIELLLDSHLRHLVFHLGVLGPLAVDSIILLRVEDKRMVFRALLFGKRRRLNLVSLSLADLNLRNLRIDSWSQPGLR